MELSKEAAKEVEEALASVPTDTPAETPAAPENTAGDGQATEEQAGGTEAAAAPEGKWWEDDGSRELAESYGLTAVDMANFETFNDFQRAAILYDRQQAARPQRQPEAAKPAEQKTAPTPAETQSSLSDLKPLNLEDFDEGSHGFIKAHNALVAHLQRIAGELEKSQAASAQAQQIAYQQQQEQFFNQFDDVLDTLDPELFGVTMKDGKPVAIDKQLQDNRAKVFVELESLQSRLLANGQPLPSLKVAIQRAVNTAFVEQKLAAARTAAVQKAKAQSTKRRPASTPRPTRAAVTASFDGDDTDSHVQRILASPDVQQLLAEV